MSAVTKIDLRRELSELYRPPRRPVIVEVPQLAFLMVDGHGDPNTSPEFGEAIEALYSVAYAAKFALKRSPEGLDYTVMPLEGLFWTVGKATFDPLERSAWGWTLMIMQPDAVSEELYEDARSTAERKRPLPALARLRLERLEEGTCAQIMHVGPYAAEGPTIERLQRFILEQGREVAGLHHEIYLSDPRRAAPEKLKTVIRLPITPAG